MARSIRGGPTAYENVRGEVAIVGVGEAEHSPASGRSPEDMAFDAIDAALADAGLKPADVDGLMISAHMGAGQLTPEKYHAHYGTSHDIWFSTEGGPMRWAATAPYDAALAIRDGKAQTIVNVFGIDWATQTKAQTGGGPASYHREEQMKANLEVVFGFLPQPVYFAQMARRHMHEYGTTQEQLGAIAVNLRRHANGHPGAVMRDKKLSMEDYLARQPFIEPLRIEDCCLISDGAAAYIMVASERAKDFPNKPVIVEGVGHGMSEAGTYFALEPKFTTSPQQFSAPAAYQMAGISAQDVDVLTIYDPFTIAALIQIEDMGFCPKGEGGHFVEGNRLAFDRGRAQGGIPFNTHGGLLSHSYVLGISHVVEVVRQLRGTAPNQVSNAEIGVYGGYTGMDAGTLVLRAGA